MLSFDYFRDRGAAYLPRTPAGALKAWEEEQTPEEAFIHKATSVGPLEEEPINLDEVTRVLAREDLDIRTDLQLTRVLEKLLGSQDTEIALFAAESINAIEARHNSKIEELRKALSGEEGSESQRQKPKILRQLAVEYLQFSQLQKTTIKNFYLKEAYHCFKEIYKLGGLEREDRLLVSRVLLDLDLYEQALSLLERRKEEADMDFMLLEAEAEFNRKNFFQVLHLCTLLFDQAERLNDEGRGIVEYWLGD